ncbi:MAG TPA: septal ring lytic transglycosylase RlpA family protein [Terriglobales bacterium]|nr:septal ring lytic transglycosylase RlpA family protein [Terriglobales bacterium]
MINRFGSLHILGALTVVASALLLASCGNHRAARVKVPPTPPITARNPSQNEPADELPSRTPAQDESVADQSPSAPGATEPAAEANENNGAAFVETGLASWYGPPYNHRRAANGEIYDMHALTAAHRTLPLGSMVRVTNLKTQNSVVVRITDRGPFVHGRIVDLSLAAAQAVDVWRPGIATVKLEVLKTPASIQQGGRWAVQIGGFGKEEAAEKLRHHLTRRYHSAEVLAFASPTGAWWLRVRVPDDDKHRAEEIARETRTSQGGIFLVRLD